MYDESGTANLRANPKVMTGSATGTGTGGEDIGGTENLGDKPTIYTTKDSRKAGGSNDVPAKTFNDKAV